MVSRYSALSANGSSVDLLARYHPNLGAKVTKTGNFQSYSASPWSVYTGMWGVFIPGNDIIFDVSLDYYPTAFPDGTTFNWNIVQDPGYLGLNGYLHVDYGNYDNSPGTITPSQVSGVSELTVDADWTLRGDGRSGMLCELWLTAAATPSGVLTHLYEIGFFPRLSPSSTTFVNTQGKVGPGYTDSHGVGWKVTDAHSSTGEPYYAAYRSDLSSFEGPFLVKDLFNYLVSQGRITGNEYFNGIAYGIEPFYGSGSLAIDRLDITYTRN